MTIRRIGRAANRGGMTFRQSLADQKRASLAAQQAMAHDGMSDAAKQHLAEFAGEVKAKIPRGPRKASLIPTEQETQKAIIGYLLHHPWVALLERVNSGAVQSDKYYVEFNRIYSRDDAGRKMRKADLCGMMKDGKYFAIEVKRQGWRGVSDDREMEQGYYLAHIREYGGIAFFATSVDDVRTALTAGGY